MHANVKDQRYANSSGHVATYIFSILIVFVVLFGWRNHEDSYLSPTDGLGYLLGIVGGVMMLLLLLYPMRKNLKFMRNWGAVKYWFKLHMLFGVVAPVLVLFHTNFELGSTNSNLALFSMLLVAGSGLVGRYFYAKLHFGLYGRKASLKELRQNLKLSKGYLGTLTLSPKIVRLLKAYEGVMLKNRHFILHLLLLPWLFLKSQFTTRRINRLLKSDLKKQARANSWEAGMLADFTQQSRAQLQEYFYCLRKTSQLELFSRLFSWWHVLHMPLFVILVVTGIVHVVVTHMY